MNTSVFKTLGLLLFGVVLLSLLAQVSFVLPWTPVPITGQTFGVTLLALCLRQKRGVAIVLLYLLVGSLGLPVFAHGRSGFILGPTSGYLLGMIGSSLCIGGLADRGWTKSYKTCLAAGFIGSVIVFVCGVIGLSFFIPAKSLLTSGVLPYIPGDLIKTPSAAGLGYLFRRLSKRSIN